MCSVGMDGWKARGMDGVHYAPNSYLTLFSIFDFPSADVASVEEVKSGSQVKSSQHTEVISSLVIISARPPSPSSVYRVCVE